MDCGPGPYAACPAPLPIVRFSTANLPTDERYAAFRARKWPRETPIYRTEPTEPFNTRWEIAELGPVTFAYTEISGMRWERRLEDIRTSDFHPLVVSMMIDGEGQGDADGRGFRESSGTIHFYDLARPSHHAATGRQAFYLIIPRSVALQAYAPLEGLHGLEVSAHSAEMLLSHAMQVRTALPRLDKNHADGLGRIFLELVAIAVAENRPVAPLRISAEQTLQHRASEEIERRLGNGRVAVADLCRALGVSRRGLFAAFRSEGGVQTYIMSQRIKRVQTALSDTERDEPIGTIAHRLGFSDAPHLSRTFRLHCGMTPREYRRSRINSAVGQPDGEPADSPGGS